MSSNTYNDYIDNMLGLPGIISVSIINAQDGMTIGYKSNVPNIDNQMAGSYQADLIKNGLKGAELAYGINGKPILNQVVINNTEQTQVLFVANNNQLIVHIVAKTGEMNIGLIEPTHHANANKL